jgi:hypothetical protein
MTRKLQKLPSTVLLTLASGDPNNPTTPEALKVIRESATTIATSVHSMLDYLEEPLKSSFIKVKNDINTMLAGLPETDKVPAALDTNYLLRQLMSTFQMAQSMMSSLNQFSQQTRNEMQLAKNSLTTEIEKAVTAKVTAGELVKKADVESRINTAVETARTEFGTKTKLVSDRRTLLTTASLPVPGDDRLLGKDEEFNPRKDLAKTRAELLKPYKVEANTLITLCWDADQPQFDLALGLLKANGTPATTTPPTAPKTPSGFISGVNAEVKKKIGCI